MAAVIEQEVGELKFQAEHPDQFPAVAAEIKVLPHIAFRKVPAGAAVLHSGEPEVKIPGVSAADALPAGLLDFPVKVQDVPAAAFVRQNEGQHPIFPLLWGYSPINRPTAARSGSDKTPVADAFSSGTALATA